MRNGPVIDDHARPLSASDAVALTAVLAVVEGSLAAGALPSALADILTHHFERAELLDVGADRVALAQALAGVGERVRASLL
ncbi:MULTISPECIES: hypothetical protein [unclassified Rathayibacter]|uniref:hypothetical protein n=1 Tax=unclassified Rathayibacter TaxID=2609250 RepID=UPI001889F828|nr:MULTISPECIES: hypothetical protein [unclassified Rathayibacter]MBF4462909.1 hypothetical protein [Rathayibacter sp. VKM Ac-2879]MBF4504323.1 hypothetical protein [Rathayibacter sp. VKM Ac-2878]